MKKIKILSWNVNGLRARLRNKDMNWFLREQPEILCLQELKATRDQIPEDFREINGYNSYFSSSEVLKGYSGVGIYSKEPETVERSFGDGRFEDEGRILKADYEDFVLFNVYFPSGASSEEDLLHKFDFYEHFLMNMQKLAEDDVKVLVCGDFNIAHKEIDLVNPKAASKSAGFLPEERAFLDRLVEYGYSDAFRMFNEDSANYTWWSYGHGCREKNLGMRLDYFFAGEGLKCSIESAYLRHDVNGSDHCPIGMDIQIP